MFTTPNYRFCQKILPDVSRTFALNIRILKGHHHKEVLLSYLLCRIADTVEDSSLLSPKDKIESLTELSKILSCPEYNSQKTIDWILKLSKTTVNFYEDKLLKSADKVISEFFLLRKESRKALLSPILKMIKGMSFFINKYKDNPSPRLADTSELLHYCYYVAGTVGELLTEIFTPDNGLNINKGELERTKISFGLGLQLTNILKDYKSDHKRGWGYIPKSLLSKYNLTEDVFDNEDVRIKITPVLLELYDLTWSHLGKALRYTLALPHTHPRSRLFCNIALFLAAATLVHLKRGLNDERAGDKISRKEVKKILFILPLINWSNRLLEFYFKKLRRTFLKIGTPSGQ